MFKAAIYIRVSTDRQALEGDSLAAQRDALLDYVTKRDDIVLAGEYIDEGISGQKYNERDGLQAMLESCRSGETNLILFTKLDRFFRSVRHYASTQAELEKLGVKWIAIWEPIYDTTTPAGQLMVNQMMSFAQFEAQNTGQRIRSVFEYKVSQGEFTCGNPPLGYDIVNKHLITNDMAPIVLEAFKYYSFCGNLSESIREFLAKGFPRSRTGFRHFLSNSIYIGSYRGNDNFCEAIIPKELFDDVQRKLSIPVKTWSSNPRTHIFTGLMLCSECKQKLSAYNTYKTVQGNRKVYLWYRCRSHFSPSRDCSNNKSISEKKVEEFILSNIEPLVTQYILEADIRQAPAKKAHDKRETIQSKIKRLMDLYLDGALDIQEYKEKRGELEEQLSKIEDLPVTPQPNIEELKGLLDAGFPELYSSLTPEERRYLWRSVISEIIFHPDASLEVHFL